MNQAIKNLYKVFIISTIQLSSVYAESGLRNSLPNAKNLAAYTLKLLDEGKVSDQGYIFKPDDLMIGRIDHIVNLKTGKKKVVIKTTARCHLKISHDADEIPAENSDRFYLTLDIYLTDQGMVDYVSPGFTDTSCSNDRGKLNNSHIPMNNEADFEANFDFLDVNLNLFVQRLHRLLEEKKIFHAEFPIVKEHVEIDDVGFFQYLNPQVVGTSYLLVTTCHIGHEDHASDVSLQYLAVKLNDSGDLMSAVPMYSKKHKEVCAKQS